MMRDGLPEDLAEMEAALRGRARAAPCPDHRGRVLAAVGAERTRAGRPWWARADTWRFAAALAAGTVLYLNLSMSAASRMRLGAETEANGAAVADLARRVQRILPDLPAQEAVRQALLARADVRLAAAPMGSWVRPPAPFHSEEEPWDTP
jgi:hypothetical protein